jgi:hypothetical protein
METTGEIFKAGQPFKDVENPIVAIEQHPLIVNGVSPPTLTGVWADLHTMREQLNAIGNIDVIKTFIKENMTDEIKILQDKFTEEFQDKPVEDPLRVEVLQTLVEIGISVY